MADSLPSSSIIEYMIDEAEINDADVHIFIDEENDDEDQSVSEDDEDISVSEDDDEDISVSEEDDYDEEEEQEEDRGGGRGENWWSVELSLRTSPSSSPSASSQDVVTKEKQVCERGGNGGETSLSQGGTPGGRRGGGLCKSEIDACPICMDTFHSVGDHHICCLPCGHLYGLSCIIRWLKKHKQKCPQCNKRCTLKDVRRIYGQAVVVDQDLVKKAQFFEAKCNLLAKKDLDWNGKQIKWKRKEAGLYMQLHHLLEEGGARSACLEKRIETLEAKHQASKLQSKARFSKMENELSIMKDFMMEKFPDFAAAINALDNSIQGETNMDKEQDS